MRSSRCSISLLCIALTLPLAAQESGDKSLNLKAGPLPVDGQALSPSCIRQHGTMECLKPNGTVVPNEKLQVKGEGKTTLLGTEVSFRTNNGDISIVGTGGRTVRLAKRGIGVESIPLPLPDKRTAVISIPVVAAEKTSATLFFRSGMVMSGSIDGDDVYFYDDDLSGTYVSGHDGLSVGSGLVFAPLGTFIPTSRALYRITTLTDTGAKLSYQKVSDSTGKIESKYANPLADAHMVLAGKDLDAVITGRKPVTVLPGSYKLRYGLLINPQNKATFAGIVAGQSPALEVPGGSDKPVALALGGPYRLDFTVTAPKRKITINHYSFRIFGKAGEQYVDFRLKDAPKVSVNGQVIGNFEYG